MLGYEDDYLMNLKIVYTIEIVLYDTSWYDRRGVTLT